MLTKKQRDLLLFINETLKKDGICPSYDEMRKHVDLQSKSGIHRLITELEQRQFLRRLPGKARSLEVLMLPEERYIDRQRPTRKIVQPLADALMSVANDNALSIPLYGKIAAGVPIEAVRDPSETVCVPAQMMGIGEHYALTVEGDSMKNAGIMDGDTVIIKKTNHAPNGTIVVALVDGYEVTLKRLFVRGGTVALQPENPDYETRMLDADRVEVQGQLVGLMRQYH